MKKNTIIKSFGALGKATGEIIRLAFTKYGLFIFISLITTSLTLFSQETKLEYRIKHGNSVIGSLTIINNKANNTASIKLVSDVKAGAIFTFHVKEKSEAYFENGNLAYSAIVREVNGNKKVNKKHKLTSSGYMIENNGDTESVCCIKIAYHLLSMFIQEPLNISTVYSDNFQRFIQIKNTGPQQYRVDFPNGIYQKYFYKNGICVKQEIHNTFYTAVAELVKNY